MPPPDLPTEAARRRINWQALGFALGGLAVVAVALYAPRGAGWLPPCLWTAIRGHTCPFCGTTRSFQSMAHGNWRQAFLDNPVAPLLFAALLGVIGWNTWRWVRSLRKPAR